jgi:hypothetical protein
MKTYKSRQNFPAKRYRVIVHKDAVLNYYPSLTEAVRYLDTLTINGRPGREMGAHIQHDSQGNGEWEDVVTAPRHLHHSRSGWHECVKVH